MRTYWLGIALTVLVVGCRGEEPAGEALGVERSAYAPGAAQQQQPGSAARPEAQEQQRSSEEARRDAPAQQAPAQARTEGVVSCAPGAQVEAAVSRLIGLADGDKDGQVSKAETHTLANFVVGGFFFRADQNGDGTVTPEEGRQARAEFMNEHPEIAAILSDLRQSTGDKPSARLARMFDAEYGKSLSMAEARDAARIAVDELYGRADVDRNGVIAATEARSLAWEGASALGRSAFQTADADRDQRLSLQEFQAALQEPARITFNLADTSNDGQLTRQEAAAAMERLVSQLGTRAAAIE